MLGFVGLRGAKSAGGDGRRGRLGRAAKLAVRGCTPASAAKRDGGVLARKNASERRRDSIVRGRTCR
jgi:hypothetical protein